MADEIELALREAPERGATDLFIIWGSDEKNRAFPMAPRAPVLARDAPNGVPSLDHQILPHRSAGLKL